MYTALSLLPMLTRHRQVQRPYLLTLMYHMQLKDRMMAGSLWAGGL